MKIGIIGGGDGFGAVLAAELAKRYLPEEVEVVIVGGGHEPHAPELLTIERIKELDILFNTLREQPIFPVVLPQVIPWPEEPKAHKPRYNRKPKWQQNGSGSKYF